MLCPIGSSSMTLDHVSSHETICLYPWKTVRVRIWPWQRFALPECFLVVCIIVTGSLCVRMTSATTEVCSGDELDASCTPGTVLMIENAEYGRMQIGGKCEISSDGCSANVTSYVEQHCAARRRCKMLVSDDIRRWASDNQGCSGDQLGYLRVTYYCLPGKRRSLLYDIL